MILQPQKKQLIALNSKPLKKKLPLMLRPALHKKWLMPRSPLPTPPNNLTHA